jgi:hypothetical protein
VLVWVVAGLDPQEDEDAEEVQDERAVLVKILGNSLLVERREGLRWWY